MGQSCSTPDKWLNTTTDGNKWPGGKVYYQFYPGLSSVQKLNFYLAIEDYHKKTCIRFMAKSRTDRNYISIEPDNSIRCGKSNVCMQNGYQFLRVGSEFDHPNVFIHELSHNLCFKHEHQIANSITVQLRLLQGQNASVVDEKQNINKVYDPFSILTSGIANNDQGLSLADADLINSEYNCQGCLKHRWINKGFIFIYQQKDLLSWGHSGINNEPIYPCRAYTNGSILIGTFTLAEDVCSVASNGTEHKLVNQFEVLSIPNLATDKSHVYHLAEVHPSMNENERHQVFTNAVSAAQLTDNHKGYVAFGVVANVSVSCNYNDEAVELSAYVIGTATTYSNSPKATFTYCGKEFVADTFQVLVCDEKQRTRNAVSELNTDETTLELETIPANESTIAYTSVENATTITIEVTSAEAEWTSPKPIENITPLVTDANASKFVSQFEGHHLTITLVSVLGIFVIVTLFLICLVIRYKTRSKNLLSCREIQALFDGNLETAKNDYEIPGNDKAFNTAYNKKLYEIQKSSFKLDKMKILGSGEFGIVYVASISQGDNTTEVAVKMTNNRIGAPINQASLRGLISEIKVLSYIGKHEHILQLHGAHTSKIASGQMLVFLELCKLGSLQSHLRTPTANHVPGNHIEPITYNKDVASGNTLNQNLQKDLLRWAHEIANGMSLLASKSLVHADLATRNVLLNEHKTAKLSDFGLSRRLYDYTNYVKQNHEPLPWRWMAPESLKRMIFNEKTDVWTYGITLWEMYTLGDQPYPGLSWDVNFCSLLEKGLKPSKPSYNANGMYDVMLLCWKIAPTDRPLFTELKELICQRTTAP